MDILDKINQYLNESKKDLHIIKTALMSGDPEEQFDVFYNKKLQNKLTKQEKEEVKEIIENAYEVGALSDSDYKTYIKKVG